MLPHDVQFNNLDVPEGLAVRTCESPWSVPETPTLCSAVRVHISVWTAAAHYKKENDSKEGSVQAGREEPARRDSVCRPEEENTDYPTPSEHLSVQRTLTPGGGFTFSHFSFLHQQWCSRELRHPPQANVKHRISILVARKNS